MLDIKLIRESPDLVRSGMRRKAMDPAVLDDLLAVDARRLALQQTSQAAQAELNRASRELGAAAPEERERRRAELKSLSEGIKRQKDELAGLDARFLVLMRQIPNLPAADVPEGASDKENVVLRTWGEKRRFDFPPKDHEQLAASLGLLDTERAARVSGSKFYYLKNELVILEQAVLRFALDILRAKGFIPMTVPGLARADAFYGAGHFSTPEDAENGDAYRLERDNLYLIGTAEVGLVSYHAGETLPADDLPLRYAGISPAYRREAGTYGKETRGLYRVHQFTKVEMVALTRPEDSDAEQAFLLSIAEEMLQLLQLPYQVVFNCGGDLGHPQYRKWDIEVWMPGLGKYGETHSCSNDTDWQARSLGIRYKDEAGRSAFVHTLNNTGLASPRILIPILENYQQADGSVRIPDVLLPYTGFDTIGAAGVGS